MNRCTQILKTTKLTTTALATLAIAMAPLSSVLSSTASAVTYQQDIGVSFTFNSTIQVNVSADLYIYNLVPGNSSDSNIINVNVLTNNAAGYTLTATVGNSTYNNTSLNHSVNSNAKFTSIANGANLASLTAPNTWGYSYSTDDGSNWSNYNGLPIYTATGATLKTSTSPVTSATGDNVKFKIAAKADSSQPSGTYNNVINFSAVATTIPVTLSDAFSNAGATKYNGYYKMQDLTSTICGNTEVEGSGSITELVDIRDNNVYKVTKLADGHCWMLDNLRLNPADSATASNITASNTNATAAAIISYLNNGIVDSEIAEPTFTTPTIYSDAKNEIDTCTGAGSCKVGIYYNYCAATVGTYCYASGSGVDVANTLIDAPYDLCPANWRMPTGSTSGEYGVAANLYPSIPSSDTSSLAYNLSLTRGEPYFNSAYLWSSTADLTGSFMYILYQSDASVGQQRYMMIPMRCIAK